MQKSYILSLLSIVIVSMASCKSSEKVATIAEYKKNILAISSGGGFTGAETIYTILENGQVFSSSGFAPDKTTAIGQLKVKEVKDLFLKASKIDWTKLSINDPGNMYKTLSFGKNEQMKKQVWGGNNAIASTDFINLYEEINKLVKPLKK